MGHGFRVVAPGRVRAGPCQLTRQVAKKRTAVVRVSARETLRVGIDRVEIENTALVFLGYGVKAPERTVLRSPSSSRSSRRRLAGRLGSLPEVVTRPVRRPMHPKNFMKWRCRVGP